MILSRTSSTISKPKSNKDKRIIKLRFKTLKQSLVEFLITNLQDPPGTLPSNTQTNPKPSTSNEKPYRPPLSNENSDACSHAVECSVILQNKIPTKLGDPGSFLIPCKLANSVEYLALADLGASINLMPYSLYAALSGTTLKPTRMSIRLANHTYQYPMGVAENMLVQVGKFMFPVDFVILQMEEDDKVPLILRRPFLHIADAIIRVKNKELNLRIEEDRATFHIDKAMQHSYVNGDTCFRMDVIDEITDDELDDLLDDFKPFLNTSRKISETPLDKEFDEFMSGYVQEDEVKDDFEELPPKDELRIRTSIQDPPTDLEWKPLPKHLEYAFLEENSLLLVVISALLKQNEKERLVSVLKNHKEAFAWKTSDIPGISPSFCKHKINFEDDAKQVIQRHATLPTNTREVVKKEIIKLLDAGIIYAIEDSPWVSPVHCVPKKGGMTVVTNEDNELVPTRTVTGWRVCIDYRKLNEATRKDHFPLPFMDQMLERLAGNKFFCFLDGFSGYFQIPIEPADQEKTTFTCPYGTYAYKPDHLSRLEKPNLKELKDEEINDEFPDEFLMSIKTDDEESPWFADFSNYLDEQYLFKACPDGMIRRCVHGLETQKILDECHHGPTRGHYGPVELRKTTWYRSSNDEEQLNELTIEEIHLMCEDGRMKAIPFMAPFPANYRETMPWASEKPYIYSVVENTCNEAKLDDLDETGKGIVIENILYVPSEWSPLEKK
ncbi:reverse transcriptase domain-containing protein [Tanacetum coccineum]